MSRFIKSLAVASVLAATASSAQAASTIFADAASFNLQVAAGSYFNSLATVGNGGTSEIILPINLSGNGFAYSISATGAGLYSDGVTTGNWNSGDPVTITFTGNPVRAIGFNVYLGNAAGTLQTDVPYSITLSDGTNDSFTPLSISNYRGYVTAGAPITSITFNPITRFYNFSNITVGDSIPEPTTLAVLAGAGVLVLRRRRA